MEDRTFGHRAAGRPLRRTGEREKRGEQNRNARAISRCHPDGTLHHAPASVLHRTCSQD